MWPFNRKKKKVDDANRDSGETVVSGPKLEGEPTNQELVDRIATMDLAWIKRLMSHNLRMPMTIIKGYADLLKNADDLTPAEIEQYIRDICKNINYMNDVLSVVIDDKPAVVTEKEDFDIVETMAEVKRFVSSITQKAGITVNINCKYEAVYIHGNRVDFMRSLFNLFENSLKYLERDGNITITVDQLSEAVIIIFRDDGVGVVDEAILEQFSSDIFGTGERGLGMGIPLVAQMVERAGGTMSIKSKPGQGFRVEMIFKRG